VQQFLEILHNVNKPKVDTVQSVNVKKELIAFVVDQNEPITLKPAAHDASFPAGLLAF